MAELLSEDEDCKTALRIALCEYQPQGDQNWQKLSIELISGKRFASTQPQEECLVCRQPQDEIAVLISSLRQLLNRETEHVLFEPSEPSFELEFRRTPRGGINVHAWLDAGNGTTGIYTWDACGIRFATTDQHLRQFIEALEAEQ